MSSVFIVFCFQRMFAYISSFSAVTSDIHLLLKTNGYFLVYSKWNELEEVIS